MHSAGSGKSNSIAWLAHRLASLHDAKDQKVFDSVVVVTDRRVLDQQLQNTIYQFEHKSGVMQKIDEDSTQLANALRSGVPIIITTLQKFPFVTEKVGAPPERRYAVIVDEAHSSQSGEAAAETLQPSTHGSVIAWPVLTVPPLVRYRSVVFVMMNLSGAYFIMQAGRLRKAGRD